MKVVDNLDTRHDYDPLNKQHNTTARLLPFALNRSILPGSQQESASSTDSSLRQAAGSTPPPLSLSLRGSQPRPNPHPIPLAALTLGIDLPCRPHFRADLQLRLQSAHVLCVGSSLPPPPGALCQFGDDTRKIFALNLAAWLLFAP